MSAGTLGGHAGQARVCRGLAMAWNAHAPCCPGTQLPACPAHAALPHTAPSHPLLRSNQHEFVAVLAILHILKVGWCCGLVPGCHMSGWGWVGCRLLRPCACACASMQRVRRSIAQCTPCSACTRSTCNHFQGPSQPASALLQPFPGSRGRGEGAWGGAPGAADS